MPPSMESNPALPPLSREAQEYLNRIRREPQFFCETHIKIRDKDNNLVQWRWNTAQILLFNAIWTMWLAVGYVRMFGVKGRQQGFSTLVAGLFVWLAVVHGKKVIIIAHKQDSTEILFEKFQTMYDNLDPQLKPKVNTDNAKKLIFANGGSITCVTAGSGEAGRGDTAQAQHRSEVGFFPDPGAVKKGVGRTVSKLKGTFIIQESTGNGENDFYFDLMKAVKGLGIYRYVFVPWFIQEEYRADVPPGFTRTDEEQELVELYNLDDSQLQWRRLTIDELDEQGYPGKIAFKQEYPNTLEEAFQKNDDAFIDPALVSRAKKRDTEPVGHEPRVIGVDPGRVRDRTVIIERQGPRFQPPEIHAHMESMELADIVVRKFQSGVEFAFIDVGMGWGTIDRLRQLGWGKQVIPVDFGSGPSDPRFLNKRAEMFFSFLEWIKSPDANLPDRDDVSSDIAAVPMFKQSPTGKIVFPSKDEIRQKIKRSIDIFDAMVCTFAYPVKSKEIREQRQRQQADTQYQVQQQNRRPSSLSARRHVESLSTPSENVHWRNRA